MPSDFLFTKIYAELSETFWPKIISIFGGHLFKMHLETVRGGVISTKFLVHRVYRVICHSLKKTFSCHFFTGRFNICIHFEKHFQHSKIVISAKSLMPIGTLYFCCAKTISFSLAKQYSSFSCPHHVIGCLIT